ncbi:MAG: hypothetical protein IPN05_15200 [Sulfuritalea sp.]|nr:hypothetical protein [Sulfuritalea sp.]
MTATDTFSYALSGADGGKAFTTLTITVTGVNDTPENTVPAAQSTNEDTALVFSSGNDNAVTVADAPAARGPRRHGDDQASATEH